ncbi:hypothetical protein FHT98_5244 [Bosea sp. AK1]|uniref:NADPH-dependent F420 reductase n=1 Tax=Bosea sp. AK1 TaxID=2587160 RepID=UPI00115338F1|nr:NAD(P)-binding domain-containing protein [Bosea sp. AK1]TQI65356.1 hypothetical protein FHT98_5244 [Bosea sp. AK1]
MTKIAIIGAGRVGSALASKLASAGHSLTFGARDPAKVKIAWQGPSVGFAKPAEAARHAAVVFNATPGDTSVALFSEMRAELKGKILIDISNATKRGEDGMPAQLSYPNNSLAEHLQAALPETCVVKTLNTMLFTVMANPGALSQPPSVFLSGEDVVAKAVVTGLLQDLGWPAASIEDLGGISTARGPEAFILLVPHVLRSHGFVPFALSLSR